MVGGFPGGSVVKNLPANAGDTGSIPGSGRSLEGGNGNPLLYSCLENPMDRGTWQATVHGVTRVRHDLATKQQPVVRTPCIHCWRAQVQSLVEEMRSHKLDSVAKKKKRKQPFLKHSFLLHSTSCVNVCVCHCLTDCHSKIQCKCNENWLWRELASLTKYVAFHEIDIDDGKLFKPWAEP